MNRVGICYFRSLYSQSACSLTMGKFSDYLLTRGYDTKLFLLKNDDHVGFMKTYSDLMENDIIIYKTNYKDFEYGIRLFENVLKNNSNKKFYLTGPFSIMNKKRILEKYDFIEGIINTQDKEEVDKIFRDLGQSKSKDSIICGIDREIEMREKGHYINLEASTGCIYNCAFCHIKLMNYEKTEKSIKLVVDEMEELYKKLGKKYFIFNDSVFWKNSKDNARIEEFIKLLKEKNMNIYFMIYLSLTIKIDKELLKKLSDVGLIRVFFGVENISSSFSTQNNKYTSENDTKEFIELLEELNISYHIGFMLISKETKYDEIQENLDFLYSIKKLFRPGMLVEKMRILPESKNSNCLYEDNSKIDQAYNYVIDDSKVEKYYHLINDLFSNVNIRNFEQFFSGIRIALTIIKRENKISKYKKFEKKYIDTLTIINDTIYKILTSELKKLNIDDYEVEEVRNIYSMAEINYVKFMSFLKQNDLDIYESIPHGTEDLNVW